LLGQTDRALNLTHRLADRFTDTGPPSLAEHAVETLLLQRITGIALGYEDLCDHDTLRHDPVPAVLAGKLGTKRKACAPLAGKSMLNRVEHGGAVPTRYHKIAADNRAIEALFVDLFSTRINARHHGSCSTSTPPTIRCMRSKSSASSTTITTATAICALHLLWPSPAGGEVAAFKHWCRRRGEGGDRARHRTDSRPLAEDTRPATRRQRLLLRGDHGLVRGQPG
jgi:hypothetical protein